MTGHQSYQPNAANGAKEMTVQPIVVVICCFHVTETTLPLHLLNDYECMYVLLCVEPHPPEITAQSMRMAIRSDKVG